MSSPGSNSWSACTAASQYTTRMESGCTFYAMALISPANWSSSSAPIDPEVSIAMTSSPTLARTIEGLYRPRPRCRRFGGVQL